MHPEDNKTDQVIHLFVQLFQVIVSAKNHTFFIELSLSYSCFVLGLLPLDLGHAKILHESKRKGHADPVPANILDRRSAQLYFVDPLRHLRNSASQ